MLVLAISGAIVAGALFIVCVAGIALYVAAAFEVSNDD